MPGEYDFGGIDEGGLRMKELAAIGGIGLLWVIIYLAFLYVVVWYIALPAISMIAKMFGYPGW